MHYITRCDYVRSHGWWVRIYQAGNQKPVTKPIQKFFGDSAYGKTKGLILAKAFRDKHIPERPHYLIHFKARKGKLKDLPVGLRYIKYIKKQYKKGVLYTHLHRGIVGSYQDSDGRQRNKDFNLNTHDWDEAVRKALKFRKQGLAQRTL
jgi:hypothetical protein